MDKKLKPNKGTGLIIIAVMLAIWMLIILPRMARGDIKISDMPAATTLNLSDIYPIVQGGSNKKASFTTTKTLWDSYYVPLTRTLTINGVSHDLSADQSWTISTAGADLHYVTTQSESSLSNEFSLGSLTTGLLKITVTSSVATPSTAVEGSDYLDSTRISDSPFGVGWNGDTTHTASKNSMYDAISSITAGTVFGPGSSTDNAVVRWDGTTGTQLQDSSVTISDTGHMTIEGVTSTGATGTGKFVFDTAPQISTIELGNASDTTLARSSAGHMSVEGSVVGLASNDLSFFTASTSAAIGVGTIELGHATDTTLSRSSSGILAVEGVTVSLNSTSATHTAGTIELGNASDTTLARSSGGHMSVEGSVVGLASDTLSFFTTSTSNTIGVGHIELGAASDTTVDRASAGQIQVEGVAVPTISSTNTLTNKRITARSGTASAPGATPTLNTDNYDVYTFTSLGTAITSMTTNLSGTPVTGDKLLLGFKDDGTARAITWGSSFQSGPATLLATTVISKQHWVGLIYDGSKWTCFAVDATGY